MGLFCLSVHLVIFVFETRHREQLVPSCARQSEVTFFATKKTKTFLIFLNNPFSAFHINRNLLKNNLATVQNNILLSKKFYDSRVKITLMALIGLSYFSVGCFVHTIFSLARVFTKLLAMRTGFY
jgi:hypothetical protein